MGRSNTSRRCRLVGYAATACVLTAVAAAPASAQAPLGLDGRSPEQATTPVAEVAVPVTGVTEQVAAAAVEPVTGAAGRVAAAAEPVSRAAGQLAGAAEPVLDATGRVAGAARPVLDATGQVAGAAKPVLDAAAGVAAPVGRLGGAAAPVGDVVNGLTRPVGGALTGDRSSSKGTWQQPPGTFGRPGSGGPPRGDAEGAGLKPPAAGGPLDAGLPSTAPETLLPGATIGSFPAAGHGALPGSASERLTTVTPDQPGTAVPQDPRADAPTTGLLSGVVPLPGLADVIAPPSPGTSTSTSRTDHNLGQVSPERQPTPAPSAPAGAAAAGAGSAGSAGPILALLALLLLAAPSLSRFFRTVPEFLRPAPFIVALERPG